MPDPGQATPRTYGIVRIGGASVAVPSTALREVVPFPQRIERLPASAPGLVGAMTLRRSIVPLLDLAAWFDGEREAEPRVVVLLAEGDRSLGLVGEQVVGLATLDDDRCQPVADDGDDMLFTAAFTLADTGDVVSVIDVDRVLSLPGVPVAGHIPSASATSAGSGRRRRLTTMRVGSHAIAIDVDRIHTTLPSGPLRASVLAGGDCLGTVEHDGHLIPVVDTLSLLGLTSPEPDTTGPRALLSLPGGRVLLQLGAVLRMIDVAEDEQWPLPQAVLRRPELFDGMTVVDGVGPVFVVDGEALLSEPALLTLASLNTEVAAQQAAATSSSTTSSSREAHADDDVADGKVASPGPEFLLMRAGSDAAVPLEQVREIVPWPRELIETAVGGAVLGLVVHRDATMPVLCTASLMGRERPARTPRSCVLVVDVDGAPTGFAVEHLTRIDRQSWVEDPDDVVPARGGPLMTLGTDTALVPAVDLRALARTRLAAA